MIPMPTVIGVGDFDGDGHPDLAVANAGSGTVSILLGSSSGTFSTSQTIAVGDTPVVPDGTTGTCSFRIQ